MSVFGGLIEQLAPLLAGPLEEYAWQSIPESWRPKVALALACEASEIYTKIKGSGSGLIEAVWSELLKDAKYHLESALGEGTFDALDQYIHV